MARAQHFRLRDPVSVGRGGLRDNLMVKASIISMILLVYRKV